MVDFAFQQRKSSDCGKDLSGNYRLWRTRDEDASSRHRAERKLQAGTCQHQIGFTEEHYSQTVPQCKNFR